MTKTTTISIEADRRYVERMGILAKTRGVSLGSLTRAAMDAMYGNDVKRVEEFLAAESGTQTGQSRTRKSKAN